MRDWGSPYRATVVGIIGDLRQAAADQPPAPAMFYPMAQFPETTLTQTLVLRTSGAIERVMPQVRAAVSRVDADQPIAFAAAMPDRIASSLAPRRLNLQLLGGFAVAALLLAGVGIYGLVAFAMAARTREIGVRMALGASPRQIALLSLTRGAAPALAGVAGGVTASLAGRRGARGSGLRHYAARSGHAALRSGARPRRDPRGHRRTDAARAACEPRRDAARGVAPTEV
jgi:hypothetical protein